MALQGNKIMKGNTVFFQIRRNFLEGISCCTAVKPLSRGQRL